MVTMAQRAMNWRNTQSRGSHTFTHTYSNTVTTTFYYYCVFMMIYCYLMGWINWYRIDSRSKDQRFEPLFMWPWPRLCKRLYGLFHCCSFHSASSLFYYPPPSLPLCPIRIYKKFLCDVYVITIARFYPLCYFLLKRAIIFFLIWCYESIAYKL